MHLPSESSKGISLHKVDHGIHDICHGWLALPSRSKHDRWQMRTVDNMWQIGMTDVGHARSLFSMSVSAPEHFCCLSGHMLDCIPIFCMMQPLTGPHVAALAHSLELLAFPASAHMQVQSSPPNCNILWYRMCRGMDKTHQHSVV